MHRSTAVPASVLLLLASCGAADEVLTDPDTTPDPDPPASGLVFEFDPTRLDLYGQMLSNWNQPQQGEITSGNDGADYAQVLFYGDPDGPNVQPEVGIHIDIPASTEIWWEAEVRFSDNYDTYWPDVDQYGAIPEHKFIQHYQQDSWYRWNMMLGSFPERVIRYYPDSGGAVNANDPIDSSLGGFDFTNAVFATELWDGRTHVLRGRIDVANGTIEAWIDGVKVVEEIGTTVAPHPDDPISRVRLSSNHNHTPTEDIWIRFYSYRVWHDNPGW